MSELRDLASRVYQARLALGNEVVATDNGELIRNLDLPQVRDANLLFNTFANSESQVDDLLSMAEDLFSGIPHRRFDVGFAATPILQDRLRSAGFTMWGELLMVLDSEPVGTPPEVDIRLVESEDDWSAFKALHELYYREDLATLPDIDFEVETSDQLLRSHHLKTPPVKHWLAYSQGGPVGFSTSWAGLDGMGQIEHLFVHPDHRLRGLAKALLHHGIQDCRRQGARKILIAANPDDTPRDIYLSMGFAPVGVLKSYWKKVSIATPR